MAMRWGWRWDSSSNGDLIVAEAGTRFQVTEASRGLGGYRHWALLSYRGAGAFGDEVCLTGRFFTAEECYAAGILARLAPTGEGRQVALDIARQIAALPPLGVRETIRVQRWHLRRFIDEVAFQTEPLKLHMTEDFKEATRAFAEKRRPAPFKGRYMLGPSPFRYGRRVPRCRRTKLCAPKR